MYVYFFLDELCFNMNAFFIDIYYFLGLPYLLYIWKPFLIQIVFITHTKFFFIEFFNSN